LSTSYDFNRSFSLFSRAASTENTPVQGKLAELESDANAEPEDSDRQLELFKALLDGGAEQGIVARWELALRAVSCALAQAASL